MDNRFKGVLEVDSSLGTIHFRHETGSYMLRIVGLTGLDRMAPTRLLTLEAGRHRYDDEVPEPVELPVIVTDDTVGYTGE